MSSGRFRRRKDQRAHCEKRKLSGKSYTTQTGKRSLYGGGVEVEWGGEQGAPCGSPTGQQAGRAGGRCCGPSASPPTLQLCWASSRLPPSLPPLPRLFPLTSSLQVELLGSDMLQLLPQHAEGGPHHGVQGPALLHQVVHDGRAAIWGVHLVSPLHTGHHLF